MPRVYANPVTKPCGYCGGDFAANTPSQRYCCEPCAKKGWRERNLEHVKERDRLWWERTHPKKQYSLQPCCYCGGDFTPISSKHRYCQRSCARRGWRENNPERAKAKALRHYYQDPEKTRANNKLKWQRELAKRPPKIAIACDFCGKEFMPRSKVNTFCQSTCSDKGWRKKNKEHLRNMRHYRDRADPEKRRAYKRLYRQRIKYRQELGIRQ